LVDFADDKSAYEFKFLVDETTARELEKRLSDLAAPDPFGDLNGDYEIATLYFDTSALDVFHRRDGFRSHKYRVRRYGESNSVFVERKDKKNRKVKKRRDQSSVDELSARIAAFTESFAIDGTNERSIDWFVEQCVEREFRPTARVRYRRRAFIGEYDGSTIRATFDRRLRGSRVDSLSFVGSEDDPALPVIGVIAELKFRHVMPLPFREMIEEFGMIESTTSKYRTCVGICLPTIGDQILRPNGNDRAEQAYA
jgi:hypothetical protein